MAAILVMLNNFFHDLTSALWFISAISMWYMGKEATAGGNEALQAFYNKIFPKLLRVSLISIGLNLVFGAIRAWAYFDYEYLPAAGRGQLTALFLKHILLFILVIAGLIIQKNLYKQYRAVGR